MANISEVLYVDDEMINLQLFEINLSRYYKVYTASSGFDGLKILKNNLEIKLVVSDMKMPNMNGIEFIRQAKKDYPQMSFFILTGFDITPEIQEALDSKLILQHFKKPFNMDEIHKTFLQILT